MATTRNDTHPETSTSAAEGREEVTPGSDSPPRTSPEAPSQRYRPGLDGLRALAIIGVLAYHAGIAWMPGGFLGVDLFFVISGFLITSLLVAELHRSGRIALVNFYGRRARRLLPALAVVLVVTAGAMAVFWPKELVTFRGDLAASLGYVANWWFILRHQSYFVSTGRPSPFQHLWSLAVEEQFYLLWPLCLLALWKRLGDTRRLLRLGAVAVLGAGASAGSMALLAVLQDLPYRADSSRVYFGTDTHASGLLLGAAAAALLAQGWGPFWRRRPGRLAGAAVDAVGAGALVALCWAMMHTSEFSPSLYRGGFAVFSATAAVGVVAVSRPGSALGILLGWTPIRWIANRSYGLYLWHWPVFVYTRPQLDVPVVGGADILLRIVVTVALADISYRLVEHPIRTLGFRTWLRRSGHQAAAAVPRLVSSVRRTHNGLPGEAIDTQALPAARRERTWKPTVTWTLAVALLILGVAGYRLSPRGKPRAPATVALPAPPGTPPASQERDVPATRPGPPLAPRPALAPPPPPTTPPSPTGTPALAFETLTAVGDSVMLGAVDALKQALPGATVNAVEGRQASGAFALLESLSASGHLSGDLILHIGTNGTIDPRALDDLLTHLATKRVFMLNVHVPRPWQDLNNRILSAAAHNHANVVLLDWNGAASAHPEWLYNDGIHLRPVGVSAYRDLVIASLK